MDSRELIFGISEDFMYSTVNWILGFAKISWIQQGNELDVGIC
jgi:hypothetical protein